MGERAPPEMGQLVPDAWFRLRAAHAPSVLPGHTNVALPGWQSQVAAFENRFIAFIVAFGMLNSAIGQFSFDRFILLPFQALFCGTASFPKR